MSGKQEPPAPGTETAPLPSTSRELGQSWSRLATSPGARKEALTQRHYPRRPGGRRGPRYAELRAASAFSFLGGASPPEDLIEAAARAGVGAMALTDRNGLYGAPRFHKAAQEAGLRALVGAEVELEPGALGTPRPDARLDRPRALPPDLLPRLTLLVERRAGYKNLCRMLTSAAFGPPGTRRRGKGQTRAWGDLVAEHAAGLHCLTGGEEGPVVRALAAGGPEAARGVLEQLAGVFPGRLHVELQRHRLRREEHRNRELIDLARTLRLPVVATNGVRYARRRDKPLHDVLTAIRHRTTLDSAGRRLAAQRERHVKAPAEMGELFADLPAALAASADLAEQLDFTLSDLGYRFPDYPLPPGETVSSYLRHVTWNAARARFRPLTAKAQRQIEHELAVIEKLDLAGYFLIVWDIVRFCQRHGILVQGRGSAANSAVCYALSITAVDPVKMELLFERFLSEERGEWPDIDLDLPSGDRRESVIQHVYERYGERGAAMTANVITYRERSAAREVAKALGFSRAQEDCLSKQLGSFYAPVTMGDARRGGDRDLPAEIRRAGLDPDEPRLELFAALWKRVLHLPRHLGQHSGGMVLAAGRLDEVVPLEPAAMEGRVVVQWDKDDCADLGIIKVDLLGLGMLNALEEAVPMIRRHEGVHVDLAQLPPEDPATYRMVRAADTVGVFQIESRAQMASLPRNNPERFYDLVIQVAIIRPGPIAGNLAHPYFERRAGRQPVTYPHPSLEPILRRTLGVPIFQEQILRVAMVAAGFTGGEAEELRRAMGFKRSVEKMEGIESRLRAGMTERGIVGDAQEEIVRAITSFALYGFPESHAASFALIAYASAYLKAHHPTIFCLSLLNAWPMGFYHPASLVQDAQRHGVEVRPIDVNRSGWRCRWEDREDTPEAKSPAQYDARPQGACTAANGRRLGGGGLEQPSSKKPAGALRLGLRFVKGLRKGAGEAIEREQAQRPFSNPDDLARRCALRAEELHALAEGGALAGFGLTRRAALWQASRAARPAGPLFSDERYHRGEPAAPSPLAEMTPVEETLADFAVTRLTTGVHPVAHLRPWLDRRRVVTTAGLAEVPHGRRVRTAGAVIVRQRPGTAKGVLFLTVEDETGMAQAIVHPQVMKRFRPLLTTSRGLVVEGILQRKDGSMSVLAERFWPLDPNAAPPSHDWH